MRILLINPNLSVDDRYGSDLGKVGPTTEPLGLAYLAAAILKKRPDDYVEIIDCAAERFDERKLAEFLEKNKFDVIGATMVTPMYLVSKKSIVMAKQIQPNAKTLIGGPHFTIFPEQTMKELPEADIGIVGEGEITIVELLDALEKRQQISEVKGIVYREKSEIRLTPERCFINDIDEIPMPERRLLPISKYIPTPTYYRKLPSLIILTSRGCPFKCTYCSKIFGSSFRFHSIDRIIAEMLLLVNDYGAKEIIFRDDTFTIKKDHIEKLCKKIIELGLQKKIRWTCMTRVTLVTQDLLKLMNKAGCWSIHYGVESGSQRLLDLIQKDITIQQIKDAFRWTKQAKIKIKAFFMLGLPTETRQESLETINFAKELDPNGVQFTITTPYPGTKLYDQASKDGTLKSLKWENYQTWSGWSDKELVYVPSGRTADELKSLQKRAMREFYLRPRIILRELLYIRSWSIFKKQISGGMALIKSTFRKK